MKIALPLGLVLGLVLAACPNSPTTPQNPDASDAAPAGPNLSAITQIVLTDIEAGKGLPQIETDVAQALGGQTGVDVVTILDDTIKLLIDAGLLPASAQSYAATLRGQIAADVVRRLQLTKPH